MKPSAILFTFFCLILNLNIQSQEKDSVKFDPEANAVVPTFIGKVILLKGNVKVKSKDGLKDIKMDSKIFPQDILETSEKSLVKIRMVDTTLFTAGPDSEVSFEDWKYRSKEDREATINLIKGKIRANFLIKAPKENAIKIKAGHASMGVRGTRVLVNHYTQSNSNEVSHFVTLEGKTQINNSKNDDEEYLEDGGQYISFFDKSGNVIKVDKTPLSDKELQYLKADDKNPTKYFRPFLKEFEGKKMAGNNGASGGANPSQNYAPSTYKGKKSPSWKKTLNNLNQRLKD